MMNRFLVVSLAIVLFSCKDKTPKGILTINQMQEIQWDLMRADEMVEYYQASDSLHRPKQNREAYYAKIFSLHHTNKEVFTQSLNYYTARPKELKIILDSVAAKAQRMNIADTVKAGRDTAALSRDSARISHTFDSLKRKTVDSLKRKKLVKLP